MITIKHIYLDIRQGIISKWLFFAGIFLLSGVLTYLFLKSYSQLIDKGSITGELTLGDSLCNLFRGMKEYIPALKEPFRIEDTFLIWNVLLAFAIAQYPLRNLNGVGKNYLVRSDTRMQWWIGKCIWNVMTVLLFYMVIYLGIFFGTYVASFFIPHIQWNSLVLNKSFFQRIFLVTLADNAQENIIFKIMILPWMAALAMSMFQMAVSFITNASIGFVAILLYCGMSAYYMTWMLLGNAMMVHRYVDVNPNGIEMNTLLLTCVLVWGVSFTAGYIRFRQRDIL